jgi:hypothetical protein
VFVLIIATVTDELDVKKRKEKEGVGWWSIVDALECDWNKETNDEHHLVGETNIRLMLISFMASDSHL